MRIGFLMEKVKNGWIISNDANLDETYVAKDYYGWDGIRQIIMDIVDREFKKCQQTDSTKTPSENF